MAFKAARPHTADWLNIFHTLLEMLAHSSVLCWIKLNPRQIWNDSSACFTLSTKKAHYLHIDFAPRYINLANISAICLGWTFWEDWLHSASKLLIDIMPPSASWGIECERDTFYFFLKIFLGLFWLFTVLPALHVYYADEGKLWWALKFQSVPIRKPTDPHVCERITMWSLLPLEQPRWNLGYGTWVCSSD